MIRKTVNPRILQFIFALLAVAFLFAFHVDSSKAQLRQWVKSEFPKTDFDNSIVEFDEIMSGGPRKDGIPAIDNPKFIMQYQAARWLNPQEPVIAVEINGVARAYPIQILIWHEIVNDELNGKHISVTFCPLCNASLVFDRNVDGEILDFGTTGRLRYSDLIMYDRQTESWWQQLTGEGLVGEYAGQRLKTINSYIVSFQEFRKAYPNSLVLSRGTGHAREYGMNPYRGYDDINNSPFMIKDPTDPRLPPMERILSVSVNEKHRVYPYSELNNQTVINDDFHGVPIVVLSKLDSVSPLDLPKISESRTIPSVTAFRRYVNDMQLTFYSQSDRILDEQTGSEWNLFGQATDGPLKGKQLASVESCVNFAFAWLVFHPDSEIYRTSQN